MDLLIEYGMQVAATLLITLIGVLGTWLTLQLGKNAKLKNLNEAQQQIIAIAKDTVLEVKQKLTDDLKAAAKDGKLTDEEKEQAKDTFIELITPKLSSISVKILQAASIDVENFVLGQADTFIKQLELGIIE